MKFGAKLATAVQVLSSTKLTAKAPAGSGTVTVAITANGGTSEATSTNRFTDASGAGISCVPCKRTKRQFDAGNHRRLRLQEHQHRQSQRHQDQRNSAKLVQHCGHHPPGHRRGRRPGFQRHDRQSVVVEVEVHLPAAIAHRPLQPDRADRRRRDRDSDREAFDKPTALASEVSGYRRLGGPIERDSQRP